MTVFLSIFGALALIVALAAWREITAVILSGRPLPGTPRCDGCGEPLDAYDDIITPHDCTPARAER